MIPVKHIDPDDIALYAMQLLPPDETEEMALHLQHSAEARRVLSEIYADLAIFAHSADMQSPPALARQRLMKHVAREKKAVPVNPLANLPGAASGGFAARPITSIFEEEEVPEKSLVQKVLPWAGWAMAAGLAGLAFTQYQEKTELKSALNLTQAEMTKTVANAEMANTLMETMKDPNAVHFALTSTDQKPPPQGGVTYVAEKGSLVLTASNLDKLPPYKIYELWLIPQDGHDPIPAGTFRPDARGFANVVMPELPKGIAAKTFGVTVEDGEGSQTPTMPIVMKGQTS